MNSPILAPVVVLVAWSLIMLIWMVASRLPAMKAAGIDINVARGGRPGGLDGMLPEKAQWPAHNYIHLMEQPTLFYAICCVLALVEQGGVTLRRILREARRGGIPPKDMLRNSVLIYKRYLEQNKLEFAFIVGERSGGSRFHTRRASC